MLAIALGRAVVEAGHRVCFSTAADLAAKREQHFYIPDALAASPAGCGEASSPRFLGGLGRGTASGLPDPRWNRNPAILAGRVLRARTSAGVTQEVCALLVTYQISATAMADATGPSVRTAGSRRRQLQRHLLADQDPGRGVPVHPQSLRLIVTLPSKATRKLPDGFSARSARSPR